MRNQPINKRLQEVKKQGRLSLFARIAWNKEIARDTIREMNLEQQMLDKRVLPCGEDYCPFIPYEVACETCGLNKIN